MRARTLLAALPAVVALSLLPAGADAAGLTKRQAVKAAKHEAWHHVQAFGISYPPSLWSASCRRARTNVYSCRVVTTSLQCSGRLTVYRSGGRTKTRRVRIGCAE